MKEATMTIMSPKKNWIHLDRAELLTVFIVLALSHGLLYVLGVLTGYGLNSDQIAHVVSDGHAEKSVAQHEDDHGADTKHGAATRSPASKNSDKKDDPGSALRKAFKESKQQAMNELVLRKGVPDSKPKSVNDIEAHLGSHSEWDRKPASVDVAAVTPEKEAPAKPAADSGTLKSVSGLFERKPQSIDNYSPRAGTYSVQVASFSTEDEAQAKVAELRKSGYDDAFVKSVTNESGTAWYRVGVGSYPTKQWAQKTGEKIIRRKLAHDYIVRQFNN